VTIACPDCGALQHVPPLPRRAKAACRLCQADLEKTSGRSITAALACSLGTFLLLFPSNIAPLTHVDPFGMHAENVIGVGIERLWNHKWLLISGASTVLVIAIPFVRFGLLSAVLGSLRLGCPLAVLSSGVTRIRSSAPAGAPFLGLAMLPKRVKGAW